MKKLIFGLLATVVFGFVGNAQEGESFLNSISFKEKNYSPSDCDLINKYVNESFAYQIILPRNEIKVEVEVDIVRIVNNLTKETIILKNIVSNEGKTTFDAVVKDENISGFAFNGNNFVSQLRGAGWGALVLSIVAAIIDATQASAMEQCTAAMNALNCGSGGRPYMNFREGWFSITCSVGCR